jgi:hypothetical protein
MDKRFISVCFLVASVNAAQAVECQTSVQGGEGHWAWRLIEGRKCWYQGAIGMDKSLLHWSAAEASLDRPEDSPTMTGGKKTQAALEGQPIPPELTKMLPVMPSQPTFEDRWRLH